jgi:hypothetical protein
VTYVGPLFSSHYHVPRGTLVFPCQRLHVGAQIECQSVAVGSTIAEGRARARSAQQIHDILVALLKGDHPRGFVEIILNIYIAPFSSKALTTMR